MTPPRIEEIDPNFVLQKIGDRELAFVGITRPPFTLNGLGWFDREKTFCRLPQARLPEVNDGVRGLAWNTAGVRLRFRTNSTTLALRWLVSFSKARREKTMIERLANEILDASNGLGAAVKRREDTHKMAEANRAFAHYRW